MLGARVICTSQARKEFCGPITQCVEALFTRDVSWREKVIEEVRIHIRTKLSGSFFVLTYA